MMRHLLLALCVGATGCAGDERVEAEEERLAAPGAPGGQAEPPPACTSPPQGICSGLTEITRCVDGEDVTEACKADARCFDIGGPKCLTQAVACAGVGPMGRCDGDENVRCDSGWPVRTLCTDGGDVCGYLDDSAGYTCQPIAEVGAQVVLGQAQYEDRPVAPGQLLPIQLLPMRGANVWVVRDSDNASLAKAVTADDGTFFLRYDSPPGQKVRVVVGTSSNVAVRPVKVIKNNGQTHGVGSSPFFPDAAPVANLLATEASARAQAANAFDVAVFGMDKTREFGHSGPLSSLTIRYEKGVTTGSFYQGGSLRRMTLAGGADDDGFDDVIVLHEFGHYHQNEYGWSQSPGGPHPSSGGDDPRLAWGEGQATNIANAFLRLPFYIDTNDTNGGWFVELEDRIHATSNGKPMSQFLFEWMVAEVLWDVGDEGADADDDGVDASHAEVTQVTASYFYSNDYVGRGYSGVDLVDWLDGWFWRNGTATCDAMRGLLARYDFPYDFNGPVACPPAVDDD